VAQLSVGNILDVDPLDAEGALPLVLGPDARVGIVIDWRDHLSDATKVTGAVH
jgi:hypothetical protein